MSCQGTGSNCRPSAFQELYHPESTCQVKAPTAQLTCIDGADRLFSLPLTRTTSVPELPFRPWDSCGIGRRVAELWDFCGARRSPLPVQPIRRGAPGAAASGD